MRPEDAEISDLIVDYDPGTLARRKVPWRPVLEYFQARRNRAAARVVSAQFGRQLRRM
jgi:hypothetical protein